MRPNAKIRNFAIVFTSGLTLGSALLLGSCGKKPLPLTEIKARELKMQAQLPIDSTYERWIQPYRTQLDAQLNQPLSNAVKTIDKSGEWQTPMGQLLADLTLTQGQPVFKKLKDKAIDGCLLNHGGIRTILPQGTLTARNAYEVMPFENSAVVIELDGATLIDLCQHIINEKKPHPLAGIRFRISPEGRAVDIEVQGKSIQLQQHYYIVTSDYLANGGDAMLFFKKGYSRTDLGYKLRDMMIDYFKTHPSIEAATDIRIIKN